MWYLTRRKYYQIGGGKDLGLTYYMVEMEDGNHQRRQLQRVYEQQPQKTDIRMLIKSTQPSFNQPLWTMDELQQAVYLSNSNKTSSSNSSSNYHPYYMSKDHQCYEQIKVYKPTWDTWQEDQSEVQIGIKSEQGQKQIDREVWDDDGMQEEW